MNLIAWPQAKIDFLAEQGYSPTTLTRFWRRVRFTSSCWLWTGATQRGYGALQIGTKSSHIIRAHRLSWMIHFGEIPDLLWVLHDCPIKDNKLCVNPAHLGLGTRDMNSQDMVDKQGSAKGERHGNAKLTTSQVLLIRELYQKGYLQKDIAEKFGLSSQYVSDLILRKDWRHI